MRAGKKALYLAAAGVLGLFCLMACGSFHKGGSAEAPEEINLRESGGQEEVKKALSAAGIPDADSREFFREVERFNTAVGNASTEDEMADRWEKAYPDFVGTNCRINSYCLLKNSIEIPKLEKDDSLLFVDNDAIDKGKVFDAEDKDAFDILFSRVKTEVTTDVKVHAAKMEQFLSQFKFNENARMLSVVVHDDLDGQSLFIGHVGILVPSEDGYLFVEKLTFEEPYQAIKFATKEDCYKYLDTKYENYTCEDLAKSFIMDND